MVKFKAFSSLNWIFLAISFNNLKMASLEAKSENFSVAAVGCREFASNYHKAIARETEGGIVNSPLSTHLVLSCLSHGAKNHTAREMTTGLCLTSAENLPASYKSIVDNFGKMDRVELHLANAVFIQQGVDLKKNFLSDGKDFYNFTVENIDFGDNAASAKEINSWVSKHTREKINSIVEPDDISDYTKLILVNAVYFKGEWKTQFPIDSTSDGTFHLSETSNKQVPMMMMKKFKFTHGELPSLKSRFLEIPYKDEKVDMIVVLPNEIEGLKFVEENFDWNAIVAAERTTSTTNLQLPKFKIETRIDLKKILVQLGFTSMFEDNADFSELSDLPLKVDNVIQKAFLEVNELGSEAAAATAVRVIMKRSLGHTNEFFVDRPFMVAVRHVGDNAPLFLASVRDISVTPKRDEL